MHHRSIRRPLALASVVISLILVYLTLGAPIPGFPLTPGQLSLESSGIWKGSTIGGLPAAGLLIFCFLATAGLAGLLATKSPARLLGIGFFFVSLAAAILIAREAVLVWSGVTLLPKLRVLVLGVGALVLCALSGAIGSRMDGSGRDISLWHEIGGGATVLGLLFLVGSISSPSLQTLSGLTPMSTQEFAYWFRRQPRIERAIVDDHFPVNVLVFIDYQCPPCHRAFEQLKPVIEYYTRHYADQVTFSWRDFPLETECNSAVDKDLHKLACEEAAAVYLAGQVDHAEQMRRWLFSFSGTLTPELLTEGTENLLGRSVSREELLEAKGAIERDVQLGTSLGVSGTPTMFVNGVKLPGIIPSLVRTAIDLELKSASTHSRRQ